jgi:hypothetical protein
VGPGQARRLFVDGHARGFLCLADCWKLGDLELKAKGIHF